MDCDGRTSKCGSASSAPLRKALVKAAMPWLPIWLLARDIAVKFGSAPLPRAVERAFMPSSPIWFPARKSACRVREGSVNLNLAANRIGSDGMTALATALGKGALANLQALSFGDFLGYCNIGDDGMKAFADALVKGALPKLKIGGGYQDRLTL